ncbi:galectin-4 isoform X26 [Oreochromis niloticus]|uniref:galectin-4 isoform X26 n=1 Tax=Oreochromis niloticus TaxID=8128 RepID=UPI000DF43C64|nr:galectin-4 isoform X26 [Oreochromis niloticus]
MSVQWDPDHQRLRAPWRTRPCSRIESHLDLVGLADPPGLFLAHSAVTRMMDDLLGSAASRRTSGNSWFLCVPENIPYLGPINGGLREGMSIYIQGTIPKHINRFFINLICGEYESSDIALHFNPRFDGWDKVVFNTCQNGSWGSEEKIHRMPFRKGEHFEMVIIVNFQGYQIKVNGIDFHTFQHRIPMEQVRGLQIAGDVSIQMINFIGGGMGGGMGPGGYPGGDMGGAFPGSNLPGMSGQPVYNPPVPYSSIIQGGMFPKRTIVIRGMVPYGAHKLSIKFLVSRSRDVAFHIHPRFREGIVLRNSMIGGNWGQEEREMSMNPFMEGQYFDMSIRCGNQRFKVFVNGQHLFDFFHRWQSFNEIDMLEIEGDVQISYIHF